MGLTYVGLELVELEACVIEAEAARQVDLHCLLQELRNHCTDTEPEKESLLVRKQIGSTGVCRQHVCEMCQHDGQTDLQPMQGFITM